MACWTTEMDHLISKKIALGSVSRKVVDDICRRDFTFFCEVALKELYPDIDYMPNWHIRALGMKFEQIFSGEITRSLICAPPRHLKSEIGSVLFPAWALGLKPSLKIIGISYSADLAEDFAHRTRKVMQSKWYCPSSGHLAHLVA